MRHNLKKSIKGIVAIIVSAAVIGGNYNCSNIVKGKDSTSMVYKLVWSDEFDGNTLDLTTWNIEEHGGFNNERQYYTNSENNIKVSDGTLKLIARKEYSHEKEYTSGRINTQNKMTFQYGKVEARMKLPSFVGCFPAFWMMGEEGQHPANGEIDIMEVINTEHVINGTVHWERNGVLASKGMTTEGVEIDPTEWHTYGLEWTEDRLSWYVDDWIYSTVPIVSEQQMEEIRQPFYLLFNFAIGGNWPESAVPNFKVEDSALPQMVEVDYVRVYQLREGEPEEIVAPPGMVYVTKDIASTHPDPWQISVGEWAGANGTYTVADNASGGFDMRLTAIGSDMWGPYAKLASMEYTKGCTYKVKTTFTSSIDKRIFIKIEGENNQGFAEKYIDLKEGVPYEYNAVITIPAGYEGRLDYFVFPGGAQGEESYSSKTAMNLKAENVSVSTEVLEKAPVQYSGTINGFQISKTNEGIRTVYTVDNYDENVVESGLVYGLAEKVEEENMLVNSDNKYVYSFPSTSVGRLPVSMGDDNSKSFAMTMRFGKSSDEFLTADLLVRAYIKTKDGNYIYSNVEEMNIYAVADYLYSKGMMMDKESHDYLYNRILKKTNKQYEEVEYDWSAIVGAK